MAHNENLPATLLHKEQGKMKYSIDVSINVDTSINKVIITTRDNHFEPKDRIVLVPVSRSNPDIYTVVNDKPGKQLNTASDVLRWLAKSLQSKEQIKPKVNI